MKLTPVQTLATTAARATCIFERAGGRYLVLPQLAADVPGQPAQMTVGDSDIAAQVLRWSGGRFEAETTLPMPGGEDAEFFSIDGRDFVATASLRTGAGPYDLNAYSVIHELHGGGSEPLVFEPLQRIATFAAKQWRHVRIGERHFLALAQGASAEAAQARHPQSSAIFEWDGTRFVLLQEIESAWGYNWAHAEIDGAHLLCYADHVAPSRILRWDGDRFVAHQVLDGATGRAFCFVAVGGDDYLAFACLHGDTVLLRRDGLRYLPAQVLAGPGGRELLWLPQHERLVLVNFLRGSREAPQPVLQSQLFRFDGGRAVVDAEFLTIGGTDAAAFDDEQGRTHLVASSGLGADIRFRSQSVVWRLDPSDT